MKRILSILLITTLFAGELEVDGGLVVTESVTASSFVGDGSGLTNLQSLGGEKPDRIYTKVHDASTPNYVLTVPIGKFWFMKSSNNTDAYYNGVSPAHISKDGLILLSGQNIEIDPNGGSHILMVFEYSISGSGNEQGMDYIVP
jgi:hypothetical protein|tara:strand:- start:455 stop:886 length:432 start_codon:yes stop_codon:yes gene_type:complete